MFLDKHIFIKRKCLTEDQCNTIKEYIDNADLIPNRGIYYLNQCRCSSTPHPFMVNSLKESLNVKKVYKLVDGSHEQIDLVTGLNSGGYTEIIKGEIQEGDEVISKVIVETSEKKALRLF